MAFVDTGDVVSGTIITEGWGDQVRANFLAGVPAIFSVKGDLAIATAPLTAARLAVGGDDRSTVLAFEKRAGRSKATLGVKAAGRLALSSRIGGAGTGSGNRLGKRLFLQARMSLCRHPTRLRET